MRLLYGSIFVGFGILTYVALAVYMCIFRPDKNMFVVFSQLAVPSLAVGIAFLINFFVGKNMLAKEMEAERDAKTSEKK